MPNRPKTRLLVVLLATWLAASYLPTAPAEAQQADPKLFTQTGYRVDDAFWGYFQRRGGVRVFGYPSSSPFVLFGFKVQIFQREIVQLQPDGTVAMMNALDDGLMPYTRANGSTFPAPDPEVITRQPQVGAPDYHTRALQFVKENAPDNWQGMNVGFFRTFNSSVRMEDAFPDGKGNAALLPGFNLEVWGLPTSKPAFDPANKGFVYQRFQRGIMHYDAACACTQGLLLADYVKAILTGRDLPPDLEAQARSSRLYAQFDPHATLGIARPKELAGSDLSGAFRRGATVVVDPGHGGKEIGSSYRFPDGLTLVEKDLNLKVGLKIAELLRANGIVPIMTRTTDTQLNAGRDLTGDEKVTLSDDLQARIDVANENRADLLVSVHFNGIDDPSKRGTQVFFSDGRPMSDRSRALAELTQKSLVKLLREAGYATLDRRATPDSRLLGDGSHFYLLGPAGDPIKRPSEMPGIIGEALFVTNEEDARALRQEKVLDAVARAYVEAITAYFKRYPGG